MSVRKAQWKSDAQFNYGSPVLDKVVVEGSGDSAYLRLVRKATPTEDVPFTIPGNYDFDPTKIVVGGGVAKLLATVVNDENWPFTASGNYTFDPAKIEVVGGKAKLKGSPITSYAWWHLNESSGANVSDASGNGRDGTCKNMEDSDWVPGKLNNCLRFNEGGDTSEYIDCGNIAGFELTDEFSFDFWINIQSWPTGNIRIIHKYDGTRGYLIYVGSSRIYVFLRDKVLGGDLWLHGSTPIGLGTWYHVIITYDGSSVANGFEIYVDGNLETKTVLRDTLAGGTITNNTMLRLGDLGATYCLDGYLDEVVIYDKELNAVEVAERWNSGNGSELMPGSFPVDNPSVYPNTGMSFTSLLGFFSETAVKPSGTEIKYHVSSDDSATWEYWDGSAWVATDGTYARANLATEVSDNVKLLAGAGTFRFRALLHTDDGSATPELDNIYLAEGVIFPLGSHEIAMNTDIQPAAVYNWLQTTELVTVPTNTDLKYQYSINSGSTWNGSWLTEPQLEIAVRGISCVGDGSDELRFKIQLTTSDVLKTPAIDNLAIIYSTGYEDSGTYTSYAYAPPGSYFNGIYADEIAFDVITPAGTTITIRVRTVEHQLEANFAKPWTVYNSGDSIGMCGVLIQFEATLATMDNSETSVLNWIEIAFHTLIGVMRTMDANVEVMRKIKANRNKIDVSNSQLVVYEDDGIIEYKRFNLLDENGQPASTNVFERNPV